jgi:hypothetical protein
MASALADAMKFKRFESVKRKFLRAKLRNSGPRGILLKIKMPANSIVLLPPLPRRRRRRLRVQLSAGVLAL